MALTTRHVRDEVSRCPACGEPVDYCPGHGRVGDPIMFSRLVQHDEGDHTECSWACPEKQV